MANRVAEGISTYDEEKIRVDKKFKEKLLIKEDYKY